jgi:hypothetical protein
MGIVALVHPDEMLIPAEPTLTVTPDEVLAV